MRLFGLVVRRLEEWDSIEGFAGQTVLRCRSDSEIPSHDIRGYCNEQLRQHSLTN